MFHSKYHSQIQISDSMLHCIAKNNLETFKILKTFMSPLWQYSFFLNAVFFEGFAKIFHIVIFFEGIRRIFYKYNFQFFTICLTEVIEQWDCWYCPVFKRLQNISVWRYYKIGPTYLCLNCVLNLMYPVVTKSEKVGQVFKNPQYNLQKAWILWFWRQNVYRKSLKFDWIQQFANFGILLRRFLYVSKRF